MYHPISSFHKTAAQVGMQPPVYEQRLDSELQTAAGFPTRSHAVSMGYQYRSPEQRMVIHVMATHAERVKAAIKAGAPYYDLFVPPSHVSLPSFDHSEVMRRLAREMHLLRHDVEFVYGPMHLAATPSSSTNPTTVTAQSPTNVPYCKLPNMLRIRWMDSVLADRNIVADTDRHKRHRRKSSARHHHKHGHRAGTHHKHGHRHT